MEKEILKLALVQTKLHWQDREANFKHFDTLLPKARKADLILIPEMFTTGFSMKPAPLYDQAAGETLRWLQKWSKELDSAISGSAIIKEGDHFYNRLYFVRPSGDYETYNKRHLFSLAGEEKIYSPGKERLIIDYCGWKINPQICFDLRFPVWCRNDAEFDLQYFVANWPERRSTAWKTLLKARAIENVCYVAGLNRVGDDGNEVYHSGDSAVHDPVGEKISLTEAHQEKVEIIELSNELLKSTRQKFAFLNDRDNFELKL